MHTTTNFQFYSTRQVVATAAAKLSTQRAIELPKKLHNIFKFVLLPEMNPNMYGFWCVCPAVQSRQETDTVRAVKRRWGLTFVVVTSLHTPFMCLARSTAKFEASEAPFPLS